MNGHATVAGNGHATPPSLAALIDAMRRPEMYPNRPPSVELRQTHISCAFLAGEYVYKIKKPVHFSFIDAATLARRHHLCLEEVRLNRRLAPDVYLGVVPIVSRGGHLMLDESGADGPVQEYAVKMRRLAEAAMLDRMVAAGGVSVSQVRAIATRLAAFHAAASDAKAWLYGSAAAVWRLVRGNLDELELDCAGMLCRDALAELERFVGAAVELRWSLLNQRARGGRVREGHGDLRCEHVSLADNSVRIIDCVEFSEGLRYVDIASDLAFLAMDLDRLGACELSDELVAAYRETSGDAGLALLLPLYKLHRALVRAKVESLTSHDPMVAPAGRDAAAEAARGYFSLACGYAQEARPALLVVCGTSGSGKSTVARRLADRTGFELLRSDVIRKRLAGVAPTERLSAGYAAGAYSLAFSQRTYAALLGEAAERLRGGAGVIVDATFGASAYRADALSVAARAGVPALFIECTASEAEIVRRLAERERHADEVSDAGVAIYLRQRGEFAALDEIPDRLHLLADTTHGVAPVVTAIRKRLPALHQADG